jgi:hypothetical protein
MEGVQQNKIYDLGPVKLNMPHQAWLVMSIAASLVPE